MSKRIYVSDQLHQVLAQYAKTKGLPLQAATEILLNTAIIQDHIGSSKPIDAKDFLRKHLSEMQGIWKKHFRALGGFCDGSARNIMMEGTLDDALENASFEITFCAPAYPYTPPEMITDAEYLSESIIEMMMIKYGYSRITLEV
jgi:hypothetical protein